MPLIVSHADVVGNRKVRVESDGCAVALTQFIQGRDNEGTGPQAMLVEEGPFRNLRTHYHSEDEFQIFIQGSGTNGRHHLQQNLVHFARKYTPYGPIIASDEGCSFLTLRAHTDSGAKFLPENRRVLNDIVNRNPWQMSAAIEFTKTHEGASFQMLKGMEDEFGMSATALRMSSLAKTFSIDPSKSDGQFIVLMRGSLITKGKEYTPLTIIFIRPDEEPMSLEAGLFGLDALILNLPRQTHSKTSAQIIPKADFKIWQCILCGFIYDESKGIPEDGILPGTRWEDIPESFGCPDCLATKSDFQMQVL